MTQPGTLSTCNVVNGVVFAYQRRARWFLGQFTGHPPYTHIFSPASPSCTEVAFFMTLTLVSHFCANVSGYIDRLSPEWAGWDWRPLAYLCQSSSLIYLTAQDIRGSQNTLLDIYERIEMFFRRLWSTDYLHALGVPSVFYRENPHEFNLRLLPTRVTPIVLAEPM